MHVKVHAGAPDVFGLSDATQRNCPEPDCRVGLLEEAIDHMDQGLLMIDADGNVPIYNRRVLEMLDLPEHLMVGKPKFRDIIAYQNGTDEFRHCDPVFQQWVTQKGLENVSHRYTRRRPDGTVLEVRSVPLPGGGAVRTFTNVTDQVQQEEKLRVTQDELIAAREKAEAANRAKSDFLAAMSHEIRTPLNAVLGLATCLLESQLGAEERRMVQTIHDSGDSLLQILNDILDFSKLEVQQLTFEEIAFSPEVLAANVVSIVGVRANTKGLKISASSEAGVPTGLIGDAGRIRQVLLNLVSNAVKFTEAGSVRISLRQIERSGGLAHVEWSVADTGIGISEEGQQKLFRDFSQADTSINRRFGGSGLGLAICKRIVEQMGGEVGVASEVGKGSTFWFRLKLPIAAAVSGLAVDDQSMFQTLKNRIVELGRPLRVLVVDDNATNRLVAGKMLSEFQPITNFACDGHEAVMAVHRFKYDVVLMDMHMPELDGLAATRAIRQAGLTVPVVAFTANAFKEDIDACRAAGMCDFVSKPVRRKDLVRAVLENVAWRPTKTSSPVVASPALQEPPRPAPVTLPSVDRTELAALVDEIGEEGLTMATQAFFDDCATKLTELADAKVDVARDTIKRAAHAIKGAAATIALVEIAALARSLEATADSIAQAELETSVCALKRAAEAAHADMRQLVPGLTG